MINPIKTFPASTFMQLSKFLVPWGTSWQKQFVCRNNFQFHHDRTLATRQQYRFALCYQLHEIYLSLLQVSWILADSDHCDALRRWYWKCLGFGTLSWRQHWILQRFLKYHSPPLDSSSSCGSIREDQSWVYRELPEYCDQTSRLSSRIRRCPIGRSVVACRFIRVYARRQSHYQRS